MSDKEKYFKFDPSKRKGLLGKLSEYKTLIVGNRSFFFLLCFELVQLFFSSTPGALGIQLRALFYKPFLKGMGKGVVLGRNLSIRHPHKISIGRGCVIDDNVLVDAKGTDNEGIQLKENVFIGRNSILSCKNGDILIDDKANIGFNCEVFSASSVKIGKACIIAAYCYVVGGGNYHTHLSAIPMSEYPDFEGKGGVTISEGVWLGAHVVVLDGVNIANDTAVAAGAVVNKNLSALCIYGGVPAKKLSDRSASEVID